MRQTPSRRPGRRWAAIALAAIGVALVVMPAIFQMWDRAPLGAEMIDEFAPYMTDERLAGFQREIAQIDAGATEAGAAEAANGLPGVTAFAQDWPAVNEDMTRLLNTIEANKGNYDAVAALPPFTLFPWFFVIPGLLVLAAVGLGFGLGGRAWRPVRAFLVVLGIGLVAAPAIFQMFDRAPKGGDMMTAFETVETRETVERIQGHFATIAVGQGAIRLELIPALRESGLSNAEIAQRFPAVSTLEREWTAILNDFTPMIGTMSDNVDNYQAVAALPPFPFFPWFFVAPGLLIAGLALALRIPTSRPPTPRESESTMSKPRVLSRSAGAATLAVAALAAAPAAGQAAKATTLDGIFEVAPGKFAGGKASGSYFRMAQPGGSAFLENADSSASDKTYTLFSPGTEGGLATSKLQPAASPGFDAAGNSLAGAIVEPTPFFGVRFGLSTQATDKESGTAAAPAKFTVKGRKITGRLQGFTAEWNNQTFNQGAPKPGGSSPKVTGTYDKKTGRYTLKWTSEIVGGPFNGFQGAWFFAGRFRAAD